MELTTFTYRSAILRYFYFTCVLAFSDSFCFYSHYISEENTFGFFHLHVSKWSHDQYGQVCSHIITCSTFKGI